MQEEHVSDRMMLEAAEWETIDVTIQRACWKWLGHVARMHVPALPKLALWAGLSLLSLVRGRGYRVRGLRQCWLRLLSHLGIGSGLQCLEVVNGKLRVVVFPTKRVFEGSGFAFAFLEEGFSSSNSTP